MYIDINISMLSVYTPLTNMEASLVWFILSSMSLYNKNVYTKFSYESRNKLPRLMYTKVHKS